MFTPRLNTDGMEGSIYWYSNTNIFYASNLGLPNCTCYAWGRFWEETPEFVPSTLINGNGGEWFSQAQGIYETGQVAKLGAIICFEDIQGGFGHVGIVEEIDAFGNITTSNSAYNSTYFYLRNLSKSNNYQDGRFKLQGFIYNPNLNPEPIPIKKTNKNKFKWVLYSRKLRYKHKQGKMSRIN